jgi:hypothetical protein
MTKINLIFLRLDFSEVLQMLINIWHAMLIKSKGMGTKSQKYLLKVTNPTLSVQ